MSTGVAQPYLPGAVKPLLHCFLIAGPICRQRAAGIPHWPSKAGAQGLFLLIQRVRVHVLFKGSRGKGSAGGAEAAGGR